MIDLNHSQNMAVRRRAGCFRVPLPLPVLIAGLGLMLAGRVTAQTFTTLHRFDGSDGWTPWASWILSDDTLYGTTPSVGTQVNGTVFAVNTDGTGFTNLHRFTASSTNSSGVYTNSDGAYPKAGLVLSSNTLYGTASEGGSSGNGAVFRLNTDGTGFTNLHSFTASSTNSSGVYTNSDGVYPQAGLVLSGNTLYGTTVGGGNSGSGIVFAINTDGAGFTNLHSFTASTCSTNSSDVYTNSDGAYPQAGLILSGSTLYGTASEGGSSGNGAVFRLNTDGTGFTNLHSFPAS